MDDLNPMLLRETPLFSDLSERRLRELSKGALFAFYPKGATLFEAGERPDNLHILVEGLVQLSTGTTDGREAVVELLQPVDAFIMAAVFTSQPYLMSARVLEPSRLILIPSALLLEQVTADPRLALTMLSSMANQYRQMVRQVKDLRLRTATQRLGVYLLRLAESEGTGNSLTLPYDKKLVAARLDMKPESLSRAIVALRDHGVEVDSNAVRITDIERLRRLCLVDIMLDSVGVQHR